VSDQPGRFPSPSRDTTDGTVCIGVWVGSEAGLDSVERDKFFFALAGNPIPPLPSSWPSPSAYSLLWLEFMENNWC
jgi:hypothetical protein